MSWLILVLYGVVFLLCAFLNSAGVYYDSTRRPVGSGVYPEHFVSWWVATKRGLRLQVTWIMAFMYGILFNSFITFIVWMAINNGTI